MAGLNEHKCPCCGGAIEFNSSVQKLKCPYCDTEFEMDTLQSYAEEQAQDKTSEIEWSTEGLNEWSDSDQEGIKVYVCNSCGGEIAADANTAATSCPYCDNPVSLSGNLNGMYKPEYVIPFKLDKKAAKEMFKKHLEGKKLLPNVFKTSNHMEEIKGIYAPYWLFGSKAEGRITYKATKNRFYSDSRYNYNETSYYLAVRAGSLEFERVPVDGSSKLDDDLMESIEPFDFNDAVPFNSGYLTGYFADKYDVDEKQSVGRANERIENSTEQTFKDSVVGYNSVTTDSKRVVIHGGKASYAMYPVWILTTKWNNELYTFAMNGQTGKFVGNLPCDKAKARSIFFKTSGIAAVITFAVTFLMWLL